MSLELDRLSFSIGEQNIVSDMSLSFSPGQFYGIIGPNGSGKTSFLRLLLRLYKPKDGRILLQGTDISGIKDRDRARLLSFVPQMFHADFSFTVRELVKMGRYAYSDRWNGFSKEDEDIVDHALSQTNLQDFRDREVDTLSGGELQRVIIARALAQDTPYILLDEPLSHLDLSKQLEILRLLSKICQDQGKTVICVMHDLNLALRFSDQVVMLREGRIFAHGSPKDVLSKENILEVFEVESTCLEHDGVSYLFY